LIGADTLTDLALEKRDSAMPSHGLCTLEKMVLNPNWAGFTLTPQHPNHFLVFDGGRVSSSHFLALIEVKGTGSS